MKLYAWDTETHLLQDGLAAPPLVCASEAGPDGVHLYSKKEAISRFHELLSMPDSHILGCNLAYDLGVMCAADSSFFPLVFKAGDEGRFHDIAVREALHDIGIGMLFTDYETGKAFAKRDPVTGEMTGRYSMKILAKRHLGLDLAESKKGGSVRYRYARLEHVPLEKWTAEERDYPMGDAVHPLDIFKKQSGHRNLHDEAAQVRASIGLQLIHIHGLRTDQDYVLDLEKTVDTAWEAARAEFTAVGIYRPNGTKDKAHLAEMVTKAYHGKPPTTPKGGISTDRDTLEESGDPILMRLAVAGKNDKRKTTYIPMLKNGFTRPHTPEFNVLVATGRISSDFQQLPQKGGIREGVIARPGTVLVSCDYEGLELRTMAQRAIWDPDVRFSKMAELLNSGMDVHTYTAATFLGCPYEVLLARVKAKDPVAIAYRSLAKIFNFGKGGGMGAAAMAYNARAKDHVSFCLLAGRAMKCGEHKEVCRVQGKEKMVCSVCVEVSRELGQKWLKAWPEQGKLFNKAGILCGGGTPTNPKLIDCKVPWSNRVRGKCGYTQWLNTPFQGLGGDGVKAAQWKVQREMYTDPSSPLWGSRLILNVHDELLAEVIEDRLHEASYRMSEIMIETMNTCTPDVKNNVEPAACRRLFKAASTTKDKNNRLKPWWPKDWSWPADQEQMQKDMAA